MVLARSSGRSVALETRVDGRASRHQGQAARRAGTVLRRRLANSTRTVRFRVRVTRRVAGRQKLVGTTSWHSASLKALPPAARVLTPGAARVVAAPAPGEPGDLFVRGTQLQPGDFVALGQTSASPLGLMAKVVSVRPGADGTTLAAVEPATLPQVIPTGGFATTVGSSSANGGTRKQSGTVGGRPFSSGPISCRAAAAAPGLNSPGVVPGLATASGSMNASIDVGADWSWGLPPKVSAHAIFTPSITASLALAAGEAVSCELEPQSLTRGKIPLGVVTVPIGAVPVVVALTGEVLLTGSVTGTAGLSAGADATVAGQAGVRINEGRRAVSLVKDLAPQFRAALPRVTVEGAGEVGVRAQITGMVNGVAGPALDVTPALRLEGGITRSPSWSLLAPVTAGVQWKADLFGLGVLKTESARYQVFGRTITLADSEVGDLTASRSCDTPLVAAATIQGTPVGLIILRLKVTAISCESALSKAAAVVLGRSPGSGWKCVGPRPTSPVVTCQRQSQRFSFVWGGGAE